MSSIFDYEDKSSLDGEFAVPDAAQFSDDADMEPQSKEKYAVRGDMEIKSFRGNKDAGSPGRHVVNLRVKVTNNDEYDGSGEVSWWFDEDGFEGTWGDISKKQVASLARLTVAMGLVEESAFDDLGALDAVEIIIDAAQKFQPSPPYAFGGMLQFVKSCKDDGRVFMNHNLYINKCPKTEVPF